MSLIGSRNMSLLQVLISVTLNDLVRRNGRYFALFYRTPQPWANYVKVVEDKRILSETKSVVQRI